MMIHLGIRPGPAHFFQLPSMMMNLDVGGNMEYTHRFLHPLTDILLSRMVVRVDFGTPSWGLMSGWNVWINILDHPEPEEDHNLVLIRYAGKLQNIEFQNLWSWQLGVDEFLPKDWAAVERVEEAWRKSERQRWLSALEFCGSRMVGKQLLFLRPSSPRVLEHLARVQVALEDRLRTKPNPSADLMKTYSRLGHFIEQRHRKVWDPLSNED